MPDVEYVIYVIYDMNGALTYIICMYVNMGVKRSVKTSGMQTTIIDIPTNCFKGQQLEYPIY